MTTETPAARSLHRKLAQVMHEVGRIPKNGTAPQIMGGYKFVQVGDATDVIRKALADLLITMIPTNVQVVGQVDRPTKSGGTMTTVDLITTWTLTDAESGESINIMSFGAGADGGDKYSGKASTSAMKYALLTGFLLSTGEDSELGDTSGQGAPQRAAAPRSGFVGTDAHPAPTVTADGGLIGTAITEGKYDYGLRQTPDGWRLPFRVKDGGKSFIVIAEDDLAHALAPLQADVIDKRITVWGSWKDETIPAKGTKPKITYKVLVPTRVATPDWTLPAAAFDTPLAEPDLDQPPDELPLFGEKGAA